MVGIIAAGIYIPLWRLSRRLLHGGLPGEKAVAHFDEDSITMGVAAARECLKGIDQSQLEQVDSLFFASTTSPYREKLCSGIVAVACDLRKGINAVDFTNSLRAGTTALKSAMDAIKSGSARNILVVASDSRLGAPGSNFEMNCGDGAVAILIGEDSPFLELEASNSIADDMFDVWRSDADVYVRGWEPRFIWEEGIRKVLFNITSQLMKQHNKGPKDFARAIFYCPEARRYRELGKSLGFPSETVYEDKLIPIIGDSGVAHPFILLLSSLDGIKPEDRIIMATYGNGADAFILCATDRVEAFKKGSRLTDHITAKKMIPNYETYLAWRGLIDVKVLNYPGMEALSGSSLKREQDQILRLYGSRCMNCGTVEYPPQRVCAQCRAKDRFETLRLADKRGKIFTYTLDYVLSEIDVPVAITVVDLDGGGRIITMMTDWGGEKIEIGMPVEMTFRKIFTASGIHNYYWKSMLLRFKDA